MKHLTSVNFQTVSTGSPTPVIIMFYAKWCSKCAMMRPFVEDIETRYRRQILFCEVDIDESPSLASRYGADLIPTFVFFQDGVYLGTVKGVFSEATFQRQLQRIFRIC